VSRAQKSHQVKVRGLNPRQLRFVQEYLVDLNASAAALRAGYSPSGNPVAAKVRASEMLAKPEIAAAIAEAQAERGKRTGLDVDAIEEHLLWGLLETRKAGNHRDHRQYVDLAGKRHGMWKTVHTGPDGGPIQAEVKVTRIERVIVDGGKAR
jgi:phage terminase small subunit